jgi:hypothetical protein
MKNAQSRRKQPPPAMSLEPQEPFRLAGSMELLVSAEELEAGIAAERERQAELFEAKMRRWAED